MPSGRFIDLDLVGNTACALKENGNYTCWGNTTSKVTGAPAWLAIDVATAADEGCLLRVDGKAECWGGGPVTPLPGPFSHIALVNTAHNLAGTTKPAEQRSAS